MRNSERGTWTPQAPPTFGLWHRHCFWPTAPLRRSVFHRGKDLSLYLTLGLEDHNSGTVHAPADGLRARYRPAQEECGHVFISFFFPPQTYVSRYECVQQHICLNFSMVIPNFICFFFLKVLNSHIASSLKQIRIILDLINRCNNRFACKLDPRPFRFVVAEL